MEAIEFIVEKQHGKTIEIPEQYLDAISGTFRVIILLERKHETIHIISGDTISKSEVSKYYSNGQNT